MHRRVNEYTGTNRGTGGFTPSPYAAKSRDAIRDLEEAPDPLRTPFNVIGTALFTVNVLDG